MFIRKLYQMLSWVMMIVVMQPCATVLYQPPYPQKLEGDE